MNILTKEESIQKKTLLLQEMIDGKVFIYPTDTVYGIGVSAINAQAIKRLIEIKNRNAKPFLIIPPSLSWVLDNCHIPNNESKDLLLNNYLNKTSFIVLLKNKSAIHPSANNYLDSVGIRFPNNWFCDLIRETGKPFISSSANISSKPSPVHFTDISDEVLSQADYTIQCNSPNGKPSRIIDLTNVNPKIIRN